MIIPEVSAQVGEERQALLSKLINQLSDKRFKNNRKEAYYNQKNFIKHLNLMIPRTLANMDLACGWVSKGVDALADRINHTGFALPGGDADSYGIAELWEANRLTTESTKAIVPTLIHGCAFVLPYRGNPALGEPEVVVSIISAKNATGIYSNVAAIGLTSFLALLQEDENGAKQYILVTRDDVTFLTRNDTFGVSNQNTWNVVTAPHGLRRVPVEVLAFRPSADSPFGQSRISRTAMSVTDQAIRVAIRTEIHGEFYSTPQRFMTGVSADAFLDDNGEPIPAFKMLTGAIWTQPAIENTDEFGNTTSSTLPQIGQFPQVTMAPHFENLRVLAGNMSSEMSLPLSSFGIVQDNPSSAEAIYASKEELVILAERTIIDFSASWARVMATAVQLRDNLPEVPKELTKLQALYRDPSTPSRAAAADAAVKLAPIVASGDPVLMRIGGLSEEQIELVLANQERKRAQAALDALMTADAPSPAPVATRPAQSLTDGKTGANADVAVTA